MTEEQKLDMACEWSDYRKTWEPRGDDLSDLHHAFTAGYAAALGESQEQGPVR
ncbi:MULTISPECIES: hypothetical protein [unclassified Rhodococcus (in: high G+C Gram-positive bacteria)]|uniref:hypothetical protein n=1 Tax=unclassified Rhodococcus (in: high G+C Gram-positive bacteria) TaxID=192944 RepID=UPI000A76263F|nr:MULTISPECIES: hypothetical protein [unclassified Rhodococcus (in: high G+C Gram-positive bacteria)]